MRGDMVESFHRGSAAIVNGDDQIVEAMGNIDVPIYPRSAIKPLQAMVLVESGAVEHYGLGNREIALACASHSGQPRHVDAIRQWLRTIEVSESSLECGAQPSSHANTRIEMIRQSIEAGAIYNNCSGKHAGLITVSKFNNDRIEGYIDRSHPTQQRVLKAVEALTGEPVTTRPSALDGCGIPVVGITLRGIARAFYRLVAGRFESSRTISAATRVRDAMAQFPELVGGDGRFCSIVASASGGQVLVKVGAEGVYAGMTTKPQCLGFALKIDDGSRRAAEVAMGYLLSRHCALSTDAKTALKPWFYPPVKTVAQNPAGRIQPVCAA